MKKSLLVLIALFALATFTASAAEKWGSSKKKETSKPKEDVPIFWDCMFQDNNVFNKKFDEKNYNLRIFDVAVPEFKELPKDFSAQSVRPLNRFSKEKLKGTGVEIFSYLADSHRKVQTYVTLSKSYSGYSIMDGKSTFQYIFENNGSETIVYAEYDNDSAYIKSYYAMYVNRAEEILEEQIPGKSYIITFAHRWTIDKEEDLGVLTKEDVLKRYQYNKVVQDRLNKVNGKTVHLKTVVFERKMLDGFPVVEKFDNDNLAQTIFDYGTEDEILVQIPNSCVNSEYDKKKEAWRNDFSTSVKINKILLPEPGVGSGDKVVFKKSYKSYYLVPTRFFSKEVFDEVPKQYGYYSLFNTKYLLPTLLDREHQYELFGDLGTGYYDLDIKLVKKENDYYRSTSGWKVYVPNKDYQEYFDGELKKGVFQPNKNDKICYKVILLQNNGKYELALKAIPYTIVDWL